MKIGQGVTSPSDWQDYELSGERGYDYSGIYVDVNTSGCGFSETPHYLVTLESLDNEDRGGSGMWEISGYTAVYSATPTGFRVLARYTDGELNRPENQYPRMLTAEHAERLKYVIRWTAITTGECSACDAAADNSGEEQPEEETTNLGEVAPEVAAGIKLYPNPSGNVLNIETASHITGIEIYSQDGKLISQVPATYQVDIQSLTAGQYVLRIAFQDGTVASKMFVKQ